MDNGLDWGTGEPSLISSQVRYIHLSANTLGKGINPSRIHSVIGK